MLGRKICLLTFAHSSLVYKVSVLFCSQYIQNVFSKTKLNRGAVGPTSPRRVGKVEVQKLVIGKLMSNSGSCKGRLLTYRVTMELKIFSWNVRGT